MPAAPKFDPDEYLSKNSGSNSFDPDKYLESQKRSELPKNTRVASGLLGAAQGATLGFADEIEGAVRTGAEAAKQPSKFKSLADVVESYKSNREMARGRYEKARRDNPVSYTAGEVAGGIGTVFVPGLGWMQAGKNVTLGAKLATAAKAGGLAAAGTSTADLTKGQVGRLAEDAAVGAVLGAGVQGAVSLTGKMLKGMTPINVAKKTANVFLNTPEEITETYIKNPEKVLTAPKRFELANEIEEQGLEKLKSIVTEGSKQSRDILNKEAQTFKASDVANILKSKADEIVNRSEGILDDPQMIAAKNWLEDTASKYRAKGDETISTSRLKDLVQSIDRNVDYDIGAGRFGRVDDSVKKNVRQTIDTLLKDKSPAYAQQMQEVSKDAQLLKEAGSIAASPKGWSNVFRRIETDQYGSGQLPKETLEKLDQRLGSNFLEKAKFSNAREAFDKSLTQGSRNVNMFSNFLKDVPVVGKIAPLIGGTVDKYGREMTMKAVDAASELNRLYQTRGVQEFVDQVRPLINLAKRGNPAAILTFQVLSESNPEALKYLEAKSQEEAMKRRIGVKKDAKP